MAHRRQRQQQQQQQVLSPPQLQAISVAMADAITQALEHSGSSSQSPAAQAGPPTIPTPRAAQDTASRYSVCKLK